MSGKMILTTNERNRCEKVIDELKSAFVWSKSDEGSDYWIKVIDKLHKYANREARK